MNQHFKRLIKECGYTQESLANKMGVNRVTLNHAINGNPSLSSLQRIADALGVPLWRLFATEEEVKQGLSPEPAKGSFRCPKCGAKMRIQIDITD